jgi:outer membrane lipoprotein-sorting protein
MLRPRRTALIAAFAALAFASPALALTADEDVLVDRAVAYLDGLNTVRAHFTQTDQRGETTTGEVVLARPGRARFQYDPPSGLLITSDGRNVTLSDSRLKSFQRFPLSSTPLAVFLAEHIRLDRGAHVLRVDRGSDGFSITAQGSQGAGGQITLYFGGAPTRLTGWAIVDPQGRATQVTLGPLIPISPPPDEAFEQVKP